jgi:hypothetical protein
VCVVILVSLRTRVRVVLVDGDIVVGIGREILDVVTRV